MTYKMVSIGELKKHPKNSAYFGEIKDTSETFWEEFKQNIRDYGVLEPLVVNAESMEVISGNQRLRAAREVKLEKVPCVLIEPEDKDTEIEQMLSANIYRRPTDALQLFELVKILRARIEGHQGKATSSLTERKSEGPVKDMAKKLGKQDTFVSAADLYHSLDKEAQKELKDWFYAQEDRPTDKALIKEVERLRTEAALKGVDLEKLDKAIEEKEDLIKELKKNGKTKEDDIKALRDDIRALNKVVKEQKEKDDLQRIAEILEGQLDTIVGQAAALSTSLVRFTEKIEKTGVKVSGLGAALSKSKLNTLRGQLNQMFDSSRKMISKEDTND